MNLVCRGIFALLSVHFALSSHYFEHPSYLIVSPNVYHPETTAKLGVDLFGNKSCDVEVNLYRGPNKVISSAKGSFTPGIHGELELKIPKLSPELRRFRWRGPRLQIEGVVCGNKTGKRDIRVQLLRDNIFIQTDKPIYKPGQTIRMRIISVSHDLKPVGDEVSSVTVQEPSGSRIMQWNNIKLQDGIVSLELPLSKEPVLGDWNIKAVVGKISATQKIEVAKYVLPKFEVAVKPPPYMALDQKEFTTSICARYTYGKAVKGKLTAVLCLNHRSWTYIRSERSRWRRKYITKSICHNITRYIDGCTEITLTRDDLNISSLTAVWGTHFNIDASVIETLTGIMLRSEKKSVNMIRRSTVLNFRDTSNQFKPGLPFQFTLKVTRPDGTPVIGAKVRVTIRRGYFYGGGQNLFYNKTFTVKNGIITVELKQLAHNAKSLNFEAELLDEVKFKHLVWSYYTTRAWFSPTLSYLQVAKTQNVPAKVDSDGSIMVRYTVRNDTGKKVDFYYNIMCRGNIVHSGRHTQHHSYVQEVAPVPPTPPPPPPPTPTTAPTTLKLTTVASKGNRTANVSLNATEEKLVLIRPLILPYYRPTIPPFKDLPKPVVEQFEIKFPVTIKMVPKCRILVYYVRADKETVADSMEYDVEDVLENQVSVAFSDDEKKPGEKTKLILKATPGSRVAFAAVDMSVSLLKAGNELTKEKILGKLGQLDRGRSWNQDNRCGYGGRYWRGKRDIVMPWGFGEDYEDASAAFNGAGVVFLTNLNIFTKPCRSGPYLVAMRQSSRVGNPGPQLENRARTGMDKKLKIANKKKTPVRIRKEFPETWLWADEKLNETSGEKTIEVTVPDTITTWIANGFGMSHSAGIGVSAKASIKSFQPFFVQMTLPYSVVRGEEIPVIVTVFNYMSSCVPIKLELNHKSADYKVISYHINKICVCGDAGQTVKFTIIPTNLGRIPLTVTAQTSSAELCPKTTVFAQDAVTRKLLVEPEGIRQEYTKGTFFCAKGGEYKEEFDLNLPKDIVPGSVFPRISLIGDVMGPALSNLDGLLRMPYGCGEQNMAKFAPNIYIMDYLTKTNQVNQDIKDKAETFMRSGYQRELTYKRGNGSYSAFGDSDKQGSMMLTAFVVRSFARAKKYIFVDDEEIEHSLKWFQRKQLQSGCFPNYGRVFSRRLQGGLKSELTITAYVTIALLEGGQDAKSPMVSRALACIVNQTDSIEDSYTTALVAYTLTLANHSKVADMMRALRSKAITKGDQMHWSASSNQAPPTTAPPYWWWHYRTPSADVEMTGYALLAILKYNDLTMSADVLNIIRWLSKQRNAYGGFSSTQDTCVALQALAEFAGLAYGGNNADIKTNDLTGNLTIKNAFSHDFTINDQNRLVLQRVEIPAKLIPNKLQVSAKGKGCALLQTSVKYNIPTPKEIPAFEVKVDVRQRRSAPDEANTPCNPLQLTISTKWLKDDVSNMAVVDVKLLSGFTVRTESLEMLRKKNGLNFKRHEVEGQHVMLYFDEIKDISFSIDILQSILIKKLKPAVVRVYDYYDPESEGKVMYNIHEKDCYGDKLVNACPRCMSVDNIEDLVNATVNCSSFVRLMKSTKGMIKLSRKFVKAQMKKMNKVLPYEIPEFCPCDQIYNDVKSLVIGKSSYIKKNGNGLMVVLNSETTIVKWPIDKLDVKKVKHQIAEILKKCKARGRN